MAEPSLPSGQSLAYILSHFGCPGLPSHACASCGARDIEKASMSIGGPDRALCVAPSGSEVPPSLETEPSIAYNASDKNWGIVREVCRSMPSVSSVYIAPHVQNSCLVVDSGRSNGADGSSSCACLSNGLNSQSSVPAEDGGQQGVVSLSSPFVGRCRRARTQTSRAYGRADSGGRCAKAGSGLKPSHPAVSGHMH